MAAFDVTTKPTNLPLKAGETGSIMVVVSNRVGRPVMGSIEGILTPASAARWLTPLAPSDALRRYEADPSATVNFEFKISVPADAAAQDVQFKAIVRDSLAPDDTKVEGQTVAIAITAKVVNGGGGTGIRWWVWLVAAVVILGVGFGIWKVLQRGGVPNVVKMSPDAATAALKNAGFDSVAIVDTLAGPDADTNVVVRQVPAAKAKVSKDSLKLATIVVNRPGVPNVVKMSPAEATAALKKAGFDSVAVVDTLGAPGSDANVVVRQVPQAKAKVAKDSLRLATIVVNRPAVEVPPVVNQPVAVAIERLKQAGLVLGNYSPVYTPNLNQNQTISGTRPAEGTKLRAGEKVDLIIYAYSATKPCPGCVVPLDPALRHKIDVWKAAH